MINRFNIQHKPAGNLTQPRTITMKLCPVAIAVGCAKCPIYKPCPLKGIIGDYVKPDAATRTAAAKDGAKSSKK